jgi:hypothetical protein
MRPSISFGAAIALFFSRASAHSWVEQMQVINDQGKFIGAPGYSRGYVPRGPGFSDTSMTYLSPPNGQGRTKINGSDLLCRPEQQKANSNSQQWPQLRAQAGSYVAMKYLENGHVTLPQNQKGKPGSGGLVYVYATTKPDPNTSLLDVYKWSQNSTLDQGRLLAVQDYDDLRCYQVNPASQISVQRQAAFPDSPPGQPGASHEQWCETDIQVPKDTQSGSLAVYWVWQWPTLPGFDGGIPNGKDEMYTTCSDFQIVTDASTIMSAVAGSILAAQDPQTAAIKNFQERAANLTLPANPAFYGPGSSVSNSSQSAPASQAPSSPATPLPGQPSVPAGVPMSFLTSTRTMFVTVTATAGAGAPTGAAQKRSAKFRR